MSNLQFLIAGLAVGAGTLSGFAVETIQSGGVWYTLDDATKTASVAPVPKGETRYTETVTIAETVTGPRNEAYTVVAIGEDAFGDSNITGVVLPSTLKTIGNRAFFNCQKLAAIELPAQLSAIGSYAFQACHSLKSITVPASVTELGNNAFYACFSLTDVNIQTSAIKSLNATFERCVSLASVTIPEGVETLNGTFDGCEKLTQVNLPSSLRTIKEFAFSGTVLSELVVPEGVTEIGYMGIANMNGEWNSNTTLRSVTLPGSLATINYNSFNNDCALGTLVIENAETALSVGDPGNAYYNAQWLATPDDISGVVPLTDLVLRRDVRDIDGYYEDFADRIFNRKTTLKNVTFGGSLTRTPALTDCKEIETITMETAVPPICGGFAQEVYDNATLSFPEGYYRAYATADGWKNFRMFPANLASNMTLSAGIWYTLDDETKTAKVTRVPSGVANYTGEITIPETFTDGGVTYTVTAVGENAFSNSHITAVTLPSTLTSIEKWGFFNCNDLGDVELPAQLSTIGDYAFQACYEIKTVVIPESVTEIGSGAYYGCRGLSDVKFNTTSVKTLNNTFYACRSLASITVPEGVEVLDNTFEDCEILTEINFPSTLKRIGSFTFSATPIAELDIPEGVTEIEDMALGNMNGEWNSNTTLGKVSLPGSLTHIGSSAFNNDCGLTELVVNDGEGRLSVGDGRAYYNALWLASPEDISGVVPLTDLTLRRDIADASGYYATIEDLIFNRKTTLKNLTFGGSLTRTPALTDCKEIETITMETTVPPVCGGFAREVYDNATLNIPEEAFDAYAEAEGWKEFAMFRNRPTILVNGLGDGETLELANMGTLLIEPTNSVTGEKYGKGQYSVTFADESVATIYSNVNTIVAHWPGETTMTISAGSDVLPATFTIRVADVDPTDRPADFREGMAWLNEEWFGHTSGSINFIDPEGKLYERAYGNQNGNMAFGATSTQAVYYADKLFVMSKQAWDGGDTRPLKSGGRVVVADAKDFRHIAAFDNIGGDGRSVVGVNPGKVYLGHTNGVRAMYINGDEITLAESDIEGIEMPRNSQIGDMIKAGNYVFVVIPNSKLIIIDSETDQVVNTVEMKKIQALAQTPDGRVWIGCSKTLQPVDPRTLEFGEVYNIGAGEISCTPGSWRPGNLKSSLNSNTLLWSTVGAWSSKGDLVRWDIDKVSDPSTLTAIYTHDTKAGIGTAAYAAPGYDTATDTWMYATNNGFGLSAMYNWLNFVDATTGELKKTIKLPDYFWFPSTPVNTDCYEPELEGFDLIELESDEDPISFELAPTDKDNLDCNISLTLLDGDAAQSDAETQEDAEKAATVTLEGRRLTVTPLAEGSRFVHLEIESNGRTVTKEIEVKVNASVGVDAIETELDADAVYYRLDGIRINGLPEQPGVYLESKAGAVRKVIVR